MNRLPPAVLGLLILNLAVFAAGFVPGWRGEIVGAGAFWFPGNEQFGVWQAVTYMFLHADLGHLFFNMFALVSFGSVLEREWGWLRFLVFYFICGVGAALIHLGVNWYDYRALHAQLVAAGMSPADLAHLMTTGQGILPADAASQTAARDLYLVFHGRMVGASGAVYGLLVAFGCLFPNAKLALIFVPVPVAAKFFVPGLLTLDLLSGVTGFSLFGAGVAHFAHLGGAAIGFLLMLLWRNRRPGAPPRWGEDRPV
jgi:membrane associated rhomboid family serine protease